MWRLLLLALLVAGEDNPETEGESSRKILGSSVVTSVSVIMDTGNGSKIFADAVGKPVSRPLTATDLASPIDLLNPDRYEFYTFNDTGHLVKRLMTLEEIQDIIATGDGDGFSLDSFTSNGFMPEKRVNDVVNNVQNVLKEEMKTHKDSSEKPQLDTPDVSDSWGMVLPAYFGNSGEDIKPERPAIHVTPDTIMIEPTTIGPHGVTFSTEQISTTQKVMTLVTKKSPATTKGTTTEPAPMLNVEIIVNSNSTTERPDNYHAESSPIIEIKPVPNDIELFKDNSRPLSNIVERINSTSRPAITAKPIKWQPSKPMKFTLASTTKPVKISIQPSTATPIGTTSSTAFEKISSAQQYSTAMPISTTSSPIFEKISIATQTPSTTSPVTEIPTSSSSTTITTTTPSTTSTSTAPITTSTISTITTTTELSTTDASTETTVLPTERIVPSTSNDFESSTITDFEAETALPTLIQLLNLAAGVTTTDRSASLTTNIPTTLGGLSTLFVVADNKISNYTTEGTDLQSTLDNSSIGDDLNTLSTEYIPLQTITVGSTNKVANSTLISTTEIADRTTPEILDQYLLTSTNIYEINSALSQTTTQFDGNVYDSTTNLQNEPITTERFIINVSDSTTPITTEIPTAADTTEQNLIQSIEQLLSQAVGTIDPPVLSDHEAEKVHAIMMTSGNKTMPEIQEETATLASNLVASPSTNSITTAVADESTTTDDSSLLDDAISSLLSQVSNSATTTISDETLTTEQIIATQSTTQIDVLTTQKPEGFVPHIINITLITNDNSRLNQSKPAKSDTSLEVEYDEIINELKRNGTLVPNGLNSSQVEILHPQATTSLQSDKDDEPSTEDLDDLETTTVLAIADVTYVVPEITTQPPPITSTKRPNLKPSIVITVGENSKNISQAENESAWTLVSTVAPHDKPEPFKESPPQALDLVIEAPSAVDLNPKPLQGFGLDASTATLDPDIYQFVQLCNELAFGFWRSVTNGISTARSVLVSPFAATSLLAMVFLGARGATSGEMNEILKLDDMVTFNPHLIFKNVSESIQAGTNSSVAASAIIRELFSDRSKGKLLGFYKDRVKQFYDGHVEEVSFREIGDVIRRRTNLLVKKNTGGKIGEFLKDSSIRARSPLAGVSVSVFQTDCSQASTEGRDGELHFMVLPSIRQRRLVPIPAVVFRSGFLAGYEPSLDATAVALGTKDETVSTVLVIPGQQGSTAPGDGLARLEKRLVESSFKQGAWSRLLRTLIARPGVELQIPRFLHRSIINATLSLKKMGLKDLFDLHKADLKGLNGAAHELYLSDIIQINEFATCGEGRIGDTHHREIYPASPVRRRRVLDDHLEEPRDYQRAFHDPLHDPTLLSLPLPLRPRQARVPDVPRLRFDRPFLYFVRHNPSGIILHMGRFHPRLLP